MLLRQTLLYLPSQLAGPALQFVFAIVWTHWLTHDDYGRLTLLIAAQELIFLCCVSWWSLFVLRFFGGAGHADTRSVLQAEPRVLALACLPQALLNLAVLASLSEIADLQLVLASTVYVVPRSFVTYFSERARTKSDIVLYTVAQTGSLAVGGLLGFALVALLAPTAGAVLAGFAISHVLVALWLISRMRIGAVGEAIDGVVLRKALVFGLPLVAAGVVNWVNLNGIRVVLEAMGGASAVGLLAVGWGLGQRLSTTAAMFVTSAAFPLAARSLEKGDRDEALRQMRYGGTLLVGMVLPAAAGLCLITPPFVRLLISESFRDVTIAIMPLAVITGAVRNIRVHYADMAFILFERTGLSVVVNVVEATFMIALCALGYATFGIVGSVAGACAASTIGALLGFAIANRIGLPMPLADWARIGLATAVMMAALHLAGDMLRPLPDLAQLVIVSGGGVILYVSCLALLFPAIPQQVVARIRVPPSRRANLPLKPTVRET